MKNIYLNAAQFKAETEKCLQCVAKPCEKACPAGVSPHDFILSAREGNFQKAAETILAQNPLAETCGLVCPDKFCQKACLRAHLDCAVNIPAIQAFIMQKYRQTAQDTTVAKNSKAQKIAVIGSGPAAIGAVHILLKNGFKVEVFEQKSVLGGALNLIPKARLPREIINADWQRLAQNPNLIIHIEQKISSFENLLNQGFVGVIAATGENKFRSLGVEGENFALTYAEYLSEPQKYAVSGNVAVIGGGAVATDCAVTAKTLGANNVEMFVRRRLSDMRITQAERNFLFENQTDITTMTRVTKIISENGKFALYTCKTRFNADGKLEDIPQTEVKRPDFELIISALGSQPENLPENSENIVYAGDCLTGSSTAVEAVASGKQAALQLIKNLG